MVANYHEREVLLSSLLSIKIGYTILGTENRFQYPLESIQPSLQAQLQDTIHFKEEREREKEIHLGLSPSFSFLVLLIKSLENFRAQEKHLPEMMPIAMYMW